MHVSLDPIKKEKIMRAPISYIIVNIKDKSNFGIVVGGSSLAPSNFIYETNPRS